MFEYFKPPSKNLLKIILFQMLLKWKKIKFILEILFDIINDIFQFPQTPDSTKCNKFNKIKGDHESRSDLLA